MKKKWQHSYTGNSPNSLREIIKILLQNRAVEDEQLYTNPSNPQMLTCEDFGIDSHQLQLGIARILEAIDRKESMIVYADYDADGVTAGAVLWETIHKLGGKVMPYIPHRVEEGYGLSKLGIDTVKREYKASLIITVDQGITCWEEVEYARSLGIDVLITDHHSKPEKVPNTTTIHTTKTSGAGVSWFVAKSLASSFDSTLVNIEDLLGLATIGIIADLIPLTAINRAIVKKGLSVLSHSKRVGIRSLIQEAGIQDQEISVYHVSHLLAPRLNAMGRLEHALDALRILCTTSEEKASVLAQHISLVNRERQQLTLDTTMHAVAVANELKNKKILIVADETYNPGIIGLAAGRLVEEFYLPSIVISKGETISKASARSIKGFNIVEALREAKDLMVEVGGHPMAAGFSIETAKIPEFEQFMNTYAEHVLTDEMCQRILTIDLELTLSSVTAELSQSIASLAPFGMGNPTPVFSSSALRVFEVKPVGAEGKHVKMKLVAGTGGYPIEAIAFSMGHRLSEIQSADTIDIAYTVEENEWNGKKSLQLKVKDISL